MNGAWQPGTVGGRRFTTTFMWLLERREVNGETDLESGRFVLHTVGEPWGRVTVGTPG